MIEIAHLAGQYTAKAIWLISKGISLTPTLAYKKAAMAKEAPLNGDENTAIVQEARARLEVNVLKANGAVLVYEGRIPLDGGKIDAVIIELYVYATDETKAVIALPYTPKSSGNFRVHRPKIVVWENIDPGEVGPVMDAFFDGASDFPEGAAIWNDSLDDSL